MTDDQKIVIYSPVFGNRTSNFSTIVIILENGRIIWVKRKIIKVLRSTVFANRPWGRKQMLYLKNKGRKRMNLPQKNQWWKWCFLRLIFSRTLWAYRNSLNINLIAGKDLCINWYKNASPNMCGVFGYWILFLETI